MSIDTKLKEMGLVLPKATDPVGSYVATKISGNLLYISGQISIDTEGKLIKGKVGKDFNTEQAYKAAERCALNLIAQAKKACSDDLSKIKSCIKLTGFVNSTDDFIDQPKVINPASEALTAAFGINGKHTRAAVSTNSLPLGVPVEPDVHMRLITLSSAPLKCLHVVYLR